MPRASKAIDAAKELSRKVTAAARGAKAAAKQPAGAKAAKKATKAGVVAPRKPPARPPAATAKAGETPKPKAAAPKATTPKPKASPAAPSKAAKAPAKAPAKAAPVKAAPVKASAKPAKGARASGRAGAGDRFLDEQRALLQAERAVYEEQAAALRAEADQIAQEMEPGDIQFDDESGEGGTGNVERERDLALSAQARAAVDEIDHALAKIEAGAYGSCESCGQPVPRPRLKAIPHARLCVACKSGGLSRR